MIRVARALILFAPPALAADCGLYGYRAAPSVRPWRIAPARMIPPQLLQSFALNASKLTAAGNLFGRISPLGHLLGSIVMEAGGRSFCLPTKRIIGHAGIVTRRKRNRFNLRQVYRLTPLASPASELTALPSTPSPHRPAAPDAP